MSHEIQNNDQIKDVLQQNRIGDFCSFRCSFIRSPPNNINVWLSWYFDSILTTDNNQHAYIFVSYPWFRIKDWSQMYGTRCKWTVKNNLAEHFLQLWQVTVVEPEIALNYKPISAAILIPVKYLLSCSI